MRLGWRLLFLALVAGAGVFSYLASTHPSFSWDPPLATWIMGLEAPGLGMFMTVLSWSGRYSVAVVSYLAVAAPAVRWGGWRHGALVLSAAMLDLSNEGIKALVGRPRPNPLHLGEAGSFPSGHTVHAVLFLGVLWLLLAPRLRSRRQRAALGALLVLLALLVGVSRVYLERHWPSDVLGGYWIGGLALWGLWWAWHSRWLRSSTK